MRNSQQEIATPQIAKPKNQAIKSQSKLSGTKKLTYCATLIAAALIFKILGNYMQIGTIRFTLFYLPLMISAVIINPIGAGIVGLGTDILGTFVAPSAGGAPLPLIVLSNTLFPLIMGLSIKLLPFKSLGLKIIIGASITTLCCTLGLTTLALSKLYEIPFWATFISRLPQAGIVGANVAIMLLLIPFFKHIKLFS